MKTLLLSTLVLTTFGFAATAAEPLSLTDHQMDSVVAGAVTPNNPSGYGAAEAMRAQQADARPGIGDEWSVDARTFDPPGLAYDVHVRQEYFGTGQKPTRPAP